LIVTLLGDRCMKTSLLVLFALAAASAVGCGGNVVVDGDATSGSGMGAGGGGACSGALERVRSTAQEKVDLLLVVDNSRSMADKQQVLALVVPDLIGGLVNPPCVDGAGMPVPANEQPPSATAVCPTGSQRSSPPVLDMHVGMLTSSLGSFGADGCPDSTTLDCPNMAVNTSNNDHGHLVTRTDPCAPGDVATYQSLGFLAWDPLQKLAPPGEADQGSLVQSLTELVRGAGQYGCGFESQNESWYRFLVDPTPYQSISLDGQTVTTGGVDTALLQQRADFLRSDSLLSIVVVTDETDTSIKESSFYPLFAQELENGQEFHLPRARTECSATGPNDPCCASCGEATPTGCADDPQCQTDPTYTSANENLGLRAFGLSGGLMSHKARYGIEFFYPPSRYVDALTQGSVQDSMGHAQPNPIFSVSPSEPGAALRDPSQVLYATITGVPWQLIARQSGGQPDLINGVSALDPSQVGGFKTSAELALKDTQGNTFWDDIAGDPETYAPPLSPFMVESTVPRSGTDPITGIAISPTSSPNGTNAINGHEWTIAQPPGDIEYACIFSLASPIDCSQPGAVCDCTGLAPDDPLCDPNPNDNGNPTLQSRAKAYPGVKNLAIAKGMGDQGVVASICAKQVTDPTQGDYGYRPAIDAVVRRMTQALKASCAPVALVPDASGQVGCFMIEASKSASCDCNAPGRVPVSAAHQCAEDAAKQDPQDATAAWNCFCEIPQATGQVLAACQNDLDPGPTASGWCYIEGDPGVAPLGNPALVQSCPSGDQRVLRFVGTGTPAPDATVFASCQGQ
jgi:hypothetical protein